MGEDFTTDGRGYRNFGGPSPEEVDRVGVSMHGADGQDAMAEAAGDEFFTNGGDDLGR